MRILGWFSKLLISVVLISFLSIFTTAYMVDLYINKFLAKWNMEDTVKPAMDAEDYISKLIHPTELLYPEQSMSEEDTEDAGLPVFNQKSINELESNEGIEPIAPLGDQSDNKAESPASSDAVPSSAEQPSSSASTTTPSSSSNELKDALVMSAQEFNEKRKKLTNKDKSEIFSILITKLPQKELQKMSLLLEDGITEEELNDLEGVMDAYLGQKEVAKLLAILNKY
jgi:hypothetical protein